MIHHSIQYLHTINSIRILRNTLGLLLEDLFSIGTNSRSPSCLRHSYYYAFDSTFPKHTAHIITNIYSIMKEEKKLIVAGKHLELTDSIKAIIEEKSEKLFSHNGHIVRMRVEVEYDPHQSTHQGEYIAKGTP